MGDFKTPVQTTGDDLETQHSQQQQQLGQQPQATSLGADEDYPVERVEAVYRKLDLRIIPGLPFPFQSLAPTSSSKLFFMNWPLS